MTESWHHFSIPVMGTGHSADTPIRVAPLGISSVISLVDDLLLQEINEYYSRLYDLPFEPLPRWTEDGRARRITAYLETVDAIARRRFAAIQREPFGEDNDKALYFRLLPDDCDLHRDYVAMQQICDTAQRQAAQRSLTARMLPGSVDVNIMVKVDRVNYDQEGQPLGEEHRDAMAALRGYARSGLSSAVVLSAGINQTLYAYMAEFPDFYAALGRPPKKRIVLKVSDFRSARIQSQYLARKGLQVSEYRVESGLNCGGHAFPTPGVLLASALREFATKRTDLATETNAKVRSFYEEKGWPWSERLEAVPALTVQGGLGTYGEMQRLRKDYAVDQTGWASPFLLVPDVTCLDSNTRDLLARAGPGDLFVSDASPLGIPFNNLRNSSSECSREALVAQGTPGSACPKGYGVTNTEFTERAICISSRQYQRLKLAQIAELDADDETKAALRDLVISRSCICDHLGNSARIALGLSTLEQSPSAVCPGPNLAWFDRTYSLTEMVDHIYGRGPSLIAQDRPHMLTQELVLYVDYYARMVSERGAEARNDRTLRRFRDNLEQGMVDLLATAETEALPQENLASIPPCVAAQRQRLQELDARLATPRA